MEEFGVSPARRPKGQRLPWGFPPGTGGAAPSLPPGLSHGSVSSIPWAWLRVGGQHQSGAQGGKWQCQPPLVHGMAGEEWGAPEEGVQGCSTPLLLVQWANRSWWCWDGSALCNRVQAFSPCEPSTARPLCLVCCCSPGTKGSASPKPPRPSPSLRFWLLQRPSERSLIQSSFVLGSSCLHGAAIPEQGAEGEAGTARGCAGGRRCRDAQMMILVSWRQLKLRAPILAAMVLPLAAGIGSKVGAALFFGTFKLAGSVPCPLAFLLSSPGGRHFPGTGNVWDLLCFCSLPGSVQGQSRRIRDRCAVRDGFWRSCSGLSSVFPFILGAEGSLSMSPCPAPASAEGPCQVFLWEETTLVRARTPWGFLAVLN